MAADSGFGGVVRDGAVPKAGAGRAASSRTALGRFAPGDAKAFVVERPKRRRGPCSYCGAWATGLACEAHADLPELDYGPLRDFCSMLREGGNNV